MRLISTFVIFIFYGLNVLAVTDFINVTVPQPDESLRTLSSSDLDLDYRKLNLITWNIQKLPSQTTFHHFLSLKKNSDLFLTQEFVLNTQIKDSLLPERHSNFSISFFDSSQTATGVATFSKGKPYYVKSVPSIGREPVLKTPKMILAQKFSHPQIHSDLLVLNIHGINFVNQQTFIAQISQAMSYIRTHNGPIIFAGDFNTWSGARFSYLKTLLSIYGLVDISMPRTTYLILDHIFIRGYQVNMAYSMENITSSDHYPLFAELSLETH